MSRVAVQLRVKLDSTWRVGDRLQVYTNFGSGAIDTDNPLLPEPVEILPGVERFAGLGGGHLGSGALGESRAPTLHTGGLGNMPLGQGELGGSEPHVTVTVYVDDAFGVWIFAAGSVDEAGNLQEDALEEIEALVSGEEPPALTAFTFSEHDDVNDKAKFAFTLGSA